MIDMSSEVERVEPRDRVRNWQRDVEIWERYSDGSGVTMAEIAQEFGLHESSISRIITRMTTAIPLDERLARQRRQIAELDAMRSELWQIVVSEPAPAYSNGSPIYMPDGTMARDYSARMKAIDLIEKLQARESKALGTDAPTRIQAEVRTVNYVIEGVDMGKLQ